MGLRDWIENNLHITFGSGEKESTNESTLSNTGVQRTNDLIEAAVRKDAQKVANVFSNWNGYGDQRNGPMTTYDNCVKAAKLAEAALRESGDEESAKFLVYLLKIWTDVDLSRYNENGIHETYYKQGYTTNYIPSEAENNTEHSYWDTIGPTDD